MFFFLDGTLEGTQRLYYTDGTESGTVFVKSLIHLTSGMSVYNSKLYFNAYIYGGSAGLWESDGTEAGTFELKTIYHTGYSGSADMVVAGDRLFFIEDDGTNGWELWVSDGTESGTMMVKDINPAGDGFPRSLTSFNNKLYFAANDGNGYELWESDGTEAGTTMVIEFKSAGGGTLTVNSFSPMTFSSGIPSWYLWPISVAFSAGWPVTIIATRQLTLSTARAQEHRDRSRSAIHRCSILSMIAAIVSVMNVQSGTAPSGLLPLDRIPILSCGCLTVLQPERR